MSTSRDALKFGAAAAVTGMAATEFEWAIATAADSTVPTSSVSPEGVFLTEAARPAITLTLGGKKLEVQPLSFRAALPPPFDADVYVWGYHVRPAVLGPSCLVLSAEAPLGLSVEAASGGRLSFTPILRQYITVDEGIYRTLPRDLPKPAIYPANRKVARDRVRNIAQPMVRLASPIPGASAGGMTPEVARQVVLVEVEKDAGPAWPVLVNSTVWDGLYENPSAPTEIWESRELMDDDRQIHLVEFKFVGRHRLDADDFRTLHDALFPGASYPCAVRDTGVVAAKGAAARSRLHLSERGPGRPVDESYVLPSPSPFGYAGAGAWPPGCLAGPAAAGSAGEDAFLAGNSPVPVSLSGFDAANGPAYVWHCHVVSRQER